MNHLVFGLILIFSTKLLMAAERDCVKELYDFNLAHKMTNQWNSDLDWGKKSFAEICNFEHRDYEDNMILDKIYRKKAREEFLRKHTLSMGEDTEFDLLGLDGEVSQAELCVAVDKYIKETSDCTSPEAYMRSFKDFVYKDLKKMCLQNLPEQKKRLISCRKL